MVINSKEDVGVLPPQLPTAVPTSTAIWEKKNGLSASDIQERIFTCGWIKGQRHPVVNLQVSVFSLTLQEGSREASSYPLYGERQKFPYSLTGNVNMYEN